MTVLLTEEHLRKIIEYDLLKEDEKRSGQAQSCGAKVVGRRLGASGPAMA